MRILPTKKEPVRDTQSFPYSKDSPRRTALSSVPCCTAVSGARRSVRYLTVAEVVRKLDSAEALCASRFSGRQGNLWHVVAVGAATKPGFVRNAMNRSTMSVHGAPVGVNAG